MQKSVKISEVMSHHVIVATAAHTFSQACQLFLEFNLHHLPIVDESDKVVGIISSYDVLRTYNAEVAKSSTVSEAEVNAKFKLADIMTSDPVTITEDETIGHASEIFINKGIQSLPVVDENGKIKGIITVRDIVKQFATYG
ncbi:MAG: CBS domain-containing protein [Sphingobacteriales bacterium]|nr:MAG: CBS domain-containing protein [Sphingobacteriales bacterium]